ncbi:hypothetical protein [Prochlorococcus sp. MIT 1303]|uniref:hypothetical protein n=1 Tax=Prochlorococcus sp. MIT 1303 TaxID=1723647 RepID=UPI0012E75E10|nr:hypothetical protein [Prochlorococcus sp. MIT 1303]
MTAHRPGRKSLVFYRVVPVLIDRVDSRVVAVIDGFIGINVAWANSFLTDAYY